MRQREIQTSEREAYEAYVLHLKALAPGCGCKPCEGILCPKGARRHAAWRDAEQREQGS